MKKLEKRAIICLCLAGVLFLGLVIFVFRFISDGSDWATFYANDHIYSEGRLNVGKITDVNGKRLAKNTKGKIRYNSDETVRKATLHAVGDKNGNISTAAEYAFKSKLVGYSLLTGTYSVTGRGNDITLTIDKDACVAAYNALAGRDGCVGVYNYKTGEIVCMVSTPTFDPENPPEISADDTSGVYLNKLLSTTMVPGSIFKLLTSAAAIETVDDIDDFSYYCTGVNEINGEKVTCTAAHGTVDFRGALAQSCNCAFAEITKKVGASKMKKYVKKCGLTTTYDMDGVYNAKGTFKFPSNTDLNLAWAGIGQYHDQLNPLSMMVYMGAIAEGGKAAEPKLIHSVLGGTSKTSQMIDESTANELSSMMKNNVESNYGTYNFPNLDIYAKSGTAEVEGRQPNAWFTGFIKNEANPYAFIVCIENGGYGSSVAGPVANAVLQEIINK